MSFCISWNCRGYRSRIDDIKSMINKYQPVCIGLQETFLKSTVSTKVRGYNCTRKDVATEISSSGGVCILTSNLYPSNALSLHTFLQAVAVQVHFKSLRTVCNIYLPPHDTASQYDLNQLMNQLPVPFILIGDFNGHSTLWGNNDTNSRGRQIEQLISDHCLCLLNNNQKTYFHEPSRTFHSLDLAICFPSLYPLLTFDVGSDLCGSDHFPLLLSYAENSVCVTERPRSYIFQRADWSKFSELAEITDTMVQTASINDAVQIFTESILRAADASIPKSSSRPRRLRKP
ncbi:hypothetical protein AVEN_177596-1 [Araneus ventricosus]|uniref:Endonuclease/exonuclease/phosphatase domain-containing protein n=1 Tax=Araneus ventricosus TaxID=182803 RepID=A0A4Y2M1N6_ARAVE|nr:hypothetical protein AVEN_177583-1 [Araneus ventricosus]GBN20973.1 hypothetical protein AVEN_177596-1 [Araneus ventricosus]